MKILRNCWTLVWLAVSAWLPGRCAGIYCYQCGSEEGDTALPCDTFVKAPVWRQFQVECPASPPHMCGKTITYNDDGTEPSQVRGCAAAENAYQVPNRIGCGSDQDGTVFCLCGTDLCNGADSPHWTTTKLFFSLLLSLILRTYLVT